MFIDSWPVLGHHWEEPGSIFFTSGMFIRYLYTWRTSWAFSSSVWTIPALSASLCSLHYFKFFSIFTVLSWTSSSIYLSLLRCRIQNWTQCSTCGLPNAEQQKITPSTCRQLLLVLLTFLNARSCCWLIVHQDPQSFFCKVQLSVIVTTHPTSLLSANLQRWSESLMKILNNIGLNMDS